VNAAPVRFSWSQLSTYDHCGEAYRLKYVEHVDVQIPQGALIGGISIHETIRASENPQWWSTFPNPGHPRLDSHPMVAYYRTQLLDRTRIAGGTKAIRYGGRGRGEDGLWWFHAGGISMLRRYSHLRRTDKQQGIRIFNEEGEVNAGVEMQVTFVLPSGKQIVGYIDVFLVEGLNGPMIRDYSTGRVHGKNPIQLAVYRKGLRVAKGIDVTHGEAVYLRSKDDATLRDVWDLRPYDDLVDAKFDLFEKGVGLGLFPLKEGPFCTACSVRLDCPYGRTLGTDDLPPLYRGTLHDQRVGLLSSETVPSDSQAIGPRPLLRLIPGDRS
jgi:hypothetical protein